MVWHKVNKITRISTWRFAVFISTKLPNGKYQFQVLENNGTHMDTWRSTFSSHAEIIEQTNIIIDEMNNA